MREWWTPPPWTWTKLTMDYIHEQRLSGIGVRMDSEETKDERANGTHSPDIPSVVYKF